MPTYGGGLVRVGGVPLGVTVDPHEAGLLNIRYVDDMVMDLSDYKSLKLIKLVGGLDGFEYTRAQIEWLEDDLYTRSDTMTLLLATGAVLLTVGAAPATGRAHHYPVGTVLEIVEPVTFARELVLVTAHPAANTMTIIRGFGPSVDPGVNYAANTAFRVAGFAAEEGLPWVPIETSMKNIEMNYANLIKYSAVSTFRNMGINRYGNAPGTDFSEQVAKALKRAVLSLEQGLLLGQRFAGAGAQPAMMGGVLWFVDNATHPVTPAGLASNSALVVETNKAGLALTLADINNELQGIATLVGEENAARTILCDYWGHRKINSFFEPSVRLAREENEVGLIVQRIDTILGQVEIISDANMPPGQMIFLAPSRIKMGHLAGPYGRLMTGDIPAGTAGDFFTTWVYGDYSCMIKDVIAMGKITDYSVTT